MENLFNDYRCFKIIYTSNRVYISNFKRIVSITSEKVIVDSNNGIIEVKGNNIISNKLINNEALFSGTFKDITING